MKCITDRDSLQKGQVHKLLYQWKILCCPPCLFLGQDFSFFSLIHILGKSNHKMAMFNKKISPTHHTFRTQILFNLDVHDLYPPSKNKKSPFFRRLWCHLRVKRDFPSDSVVKNLSANAGDVGSIPGPGRSPGERNSNPRQYSCLKNPMDRGAWWATVHRVAKNRTWLKQLSMHVGSSVYVLDTETVSPKEELLSSHSASRKAFLSQFRCTEHYLWDSEDNVKDINILYLPPINFKFQLAEKIHIWMD